MLAQGRYAARPKAPTNSPTESDASTPRRRSGTTAQDDLTSKLGALRIEGAIEGAIEGVPGIRRANLAAKGRKIGDGAFGTVHTVGEDYVLKIMAVNSQHAQQMFAREVKNLKAMEGDPHVVKLHGAVIEDRKGLMLLDMAPGKRCDEAVENTTQKDRRAAWRWFFESLLGTVHAMHQKTIYHLDLHPGNIMVDLAQKKLTVIDFGMSCRGARGDRGDCGEDIGMSAHYTPFYDENQGTENEALMRHVDLFSVGALMHLWWFGKPPYADNFKLNVPRWMMKVMHPGTEHHPKTLQECADVPCKMMRYLLCIPGMTAKSAKDYQNICGTSLPGRTLADWRPKEVPPPEPGEQL
jgi:serine/threonine protein kinase